MEQLILHGIGDFILQKDSWAVNKKKKGIYGLWCCFIHCLTYSLPFFSVGSWQAVLVIFASHFAIDRTQAVAYALAWKNDVTKYVCRVHGGEPYSTCSHMIQRNCYPSTVFDISNFGFDKEKPFAISVWCYFIADNVLHLICNYLALRYL